MTDGFLLSVVIPTMGRPILRKTLDSLLAGDLAASLFDGWELNDKLFFIKHWLSEMAH